MRASDTEISPQVTPVRNADRNGGVRNADIGMWVVQVAIPYPTSFHPASESELEIWKSTVRRSKRIHLASYAGAIRGPGTTVRGELGDQCDRHAECNHLVCSNDHVCHQQPQIVYKLALESVFCLQPPGDSPTRKGIFDSLLCGCIPVLFAPNQTRDQYLWHLPGDSNRYRSLTNDSPVCSWIADC